VGLLASFGREASGQREGRADTQGSGLGAKPAGESGGGGGGGDRCSPGQSGQAETSMDIRTAI
jgi:hypothetical protein